MFVDLDELQEEIKAVKGIAKDAGSAGKELLRNAKKAEELLKKAKELESKKDFAKTDTLVEQIKALLS